MSLINKMLQDLEQRSDAAARNEPLAGEVRALHAASASRFGPKVGLLVLLLLAAGAVAWMLMEPKASAPVVAVAPAPSVAPAAPAPALPTAPAAAPSEQSANKPQPAAQAPRTTAPQPTAVAKRAADADAPRPARSTPEAEAGTLFAQAVTKKPSKAKAVIEEAAPAVEKAPQSHPQKRVNPQQQSDNLYKQAVMQSQQGRISAANQNLRRALEANANNVRARQMLVGMLVEGNQFEEASNLLREGLKLTPEQSSFSMSLARLQLESNDTAGAMATLEQGLPSAGDEPNYHAFYAAMLQRAECHEEAVRHYLVALRSDPAMPTWLVGIGISLQAQGKDADAAEAFRRAKDSGLLTPQLAQFVEERLGRQLKR